MRYMIFDPALGYVVKDPEKGEQCAYGAGRMGSESLRHGIGTSAYETPRREALVDCVPEVTLRERVRILREALATIKAWDPAAAPDEPGGMSIMDAIYIASAALEATKEGA